jgi:biopolymer transport protein ExbB/TolQ
MTSYTQLGLSPIEAPHFEDSEVLDAVLRGTRRRAEIVHAEMGRGLSALATIGSTAAFVGLLGTCFGIINAFTGLPGEKSTVMGAIAQYISEAIGSTAVALAVAIPALLFYNMLSTRLERIEMEMNATGLALVNVLSLRLTLSRISSSCSAEYPE